MGAARGTGAAHSFDQARQPLQIVPDSGILMNASCVRLRVGPANPLSIQVEEPVNRTWLATRTTRGTRHWRIGVVLLLISVFSVAGLAKRGFCLPHSSSTHWISQACKMLESRRAAAPRVVAQIASIVAAVHPVPSFPATFLPRSNWLRPLSPHLVTNHTLRAPPSLA